MSATGELMPTPADPVDPLRPRVQRVLDRFLAQQKDILDGVGAELLPLLDGAADLLRGGKRLRPAFCYWGWRAAGGAADDSVLVTTGSSLELFQAAVLIHDDVIDGSATRRGHPSVHCRFASHHRDQGWNGDADGFGVATAILLGDLLLSWSDELLSEAGLSDDAMHRARPIFDRMRTEVGAGQYLDILAQVDTTGAASRHAERARRVIVHKSARYSVQHPLVLGGRIAHATDDVLDCLTAYGAALGEAFQLRDDVLGVFGDPAETGKPAGDDLREGKRTVLVAYALERADATERDVVDVVLGDPDLDQSGVDRLREILVRTGARDRVEQRISSLVTEARRALDKAALTADGRQALTTMTNLATARSH